MNPFKLAIFDLAGTTVQDTNTVGGCLQLALAEVDVPITVEDANSVMGIPKPVAIRELLDRSGRDGNVEAIHNRFRELMIEAYRTAPDLAEIEGTSETFSALRERGIRVTVNTGFDRETTRVLLSRLPWEGLLDDSVTSDEVAQGRPHPDMILMLCARAGVEPSEAIKVGDTPSDILEGQAAGVGLNVGVLYGTHTYWELEAYKPSALVSDIREVLTLLPEHDHERDTDDGTEC